MTSSATDLDLLTPEELRRELVGSRRQQAAMADVLGAINRSPQDLPAILDTLVRIIASLCETDDVSINTFKDGTLTVAAHCGPIATPPSRSYSLDERTPPVDAVRERRVIHIADMQGEEDRYPSSAAIARRTGARTILWVPMVRADTDYGVIILRRTSVRLFSDEQVRLVEAFAHQAMIAMENAHLFEAEQTRTRELEARSAELAQSLEYQTAISDVLGVISRSPSELQPVLDAIAETALRLCPAKRVLIARLDGREYRSVARAGETSDEVSRRTMTFVIDRGSAVGRVALSGQTIHLHDVRDDPEYSFGNDIVDDDRRTILGVPMQRDGVTVGVIALVREVVEPFSQRQIALIETFADQAVIAMENARLLDELQTRQKELEARSAELTESLEYQTATSEVLSVISRSPDKLQPVLDVVAENAARVCQAFDARLMRVVGDRLFAWASFGSIANSEEAVRHGLPLSRESVTGRAAIDRKAVHVVDLAAEPESEYPVGNALARELGHRTTLATPLLRDGVPLGAILIRRTEVKPFTDKQIRLLETFADQAVIAINNVGLFEQVQARRKELTEALEYQTATGEVLGVIARAPGELRPVLDAIVTTGGRLCQAEYAILFNVVGEQCLVAASNNTDAEFVRYLTENPVPLIRGSTTGRAALERRTVHTADVLAWPGYARRDAQAVGRQRTVLSVPLLRDGLPIGVITMMRSEVQPYTDRQITLVETFADQAVIAIENARLLDELQTRQKELTESLEYQTATSEVLGVISRSPDRLQPVFDAIVTTARRLCEADRATLMQLDGSHFKLAARTGLAADQFEDLLRSHPIAADHPQAIAGRVAAIRRPLHVEDLRADPTIGLFKGVEGDPRRTILGVPLLRGETVIGVIVLSRHVVRPFTERQVQLVTTFADQAVIAINNVGLFEEVQARTKALQARTKELTESLEYQKATSDVLSAIANSPTNVQPVLDAIVRTAATLCASYDAVLLLREDKELRIAAHHGPMTLDLERLPIGREIVAGRAVVDQVPVHVRDLAAETEEFPVGRTIAVRLNQRTVLGLPLLRKAQAIGCLFLRRTEVLPFTEKEIKLLKGFADQAVIAIENTRLFEEVQARNMELRTALEQQTATSELLKVIGRSTFQLQPVFDTLAENAVRLCSAERAFVHRFDGQFLRVVATYNVTPELRAFVERNPITPGRHSVAARGAFERRSVSIHDVQADPELTYAGRDVEPVRSALSVPMLRADELLGVIMIYRHEVRPFNDSQVALMETFADQAAIAIENTRLFEEVQARNRDLTALGEVGRAVSSTLDLKVVLKTIVDRAVALSVTDGGAIFYYRDDLGTFELGETAGLNDEIVAKIGRLDIAAKDSGLGEAIANREPLQIPDLTKRPSNPLRAVAIEAGLRASLIVPLLSADGALGALVLQRRRPGEFSEAVVSLMQSFADQSAIALENARLFEEIAQKSRELEIASQHKSQFVANMSHELRTPLAAILGYAELMQEGFYEPQGKKSLDALTRIRSNGKHLLGLINAVLDIAKIESGQFSLNLGEYAIETVIETVRLATESLAETRKLVLKTDVGKHLPVGLGDEQRLTQVLLNLVGNAIKFTDIGEVRITATAVGGHFNVAVTDTGPGIPPEELKRVFEQFHQIDNSITKAKGGTGLGLAIAKQIVEMHGGRIWVESTLGRGATFQMELPVRAGNHKRAT